MEKRFSGPKYANGNHKSQQKAYNKTKKGKSLGTLFTTEKQPEPARKQWLASLLHPRGDLELDAGAVTGVCQQDCS